MTHNTDQLPGKDWQLRLEAARMQALAEQLQALADQLELQAQRLERDTAGAMRAEAQKLRIQAAMEECWTPARRLRVEADHLTACAKQLLDLVARREAAS